MHNASPSDKPKRSWNRWFIRLPIAALFLAGLVLGFFLFSGTVNTDCLWNAPVSAWIDKNSDGKKDQDEAPLEGVQFRVNDTLNAYDDVGDKTISDWNGKAHVSVWLPGCPKARFEVLAIPPAGYQATTDALVEVQGEGYGDNETLTFGFVGIEGFHHPTKPYQ